MYLVSVCYYEAEDPTPPKLDVESMRVVFEGIRVEVFSSDPVGDVEDDTEGIGSPPDTIRVQDPIPPVNR